MIDKVALREAVINAIIHNDYSREIPPVFEIYSDRLTVTSYGGLVSGLSQADFFNCGSMPRNRELMRVFRDVGLVEQLGSGMTRILKAYDESIFEFTPNFLVITFPFEEDFTVSNGTDDGTVNITAEKIIELIKANNAITVNELVEMKRKSRRTILREIKKLKECSIIRRVGSDRTGHWEIVE